MSTAVMTRRVIDISGFWPQANGEARTVNSVVTELTNTPLQMTRYTLEKALKGDLTGADVDTIDKLLKLCSQWAGRNVSYDDITTEKG